jgi:RNA polymerase sigma factor, sigma-70 family
MSVDTWQKFLKGDEASFSELYRNYFKELFAYGVKMGFGEEACKDAIQDVFFKIYTTRNKLSHIQNIEFYLLHCLKNRLFDVYNKETIINKIDYDEIILENGNNIIEQIIDEERQLQIESTVTQFLKILPPKQRKIIYFYYHLNLNYADIAALLNMTPEAIKKSLYRSLKKMKETSSDIKNKVSFYLLTIIS